MSEETYQFDEVFEITLNEGNMFTHSNIIVKRSNRGQKMGLIRPNEPVLWVSVHGYPEIFYKHKWKRILDNEIIQ